MRKNKIITFILLIIFLSCKESSNPVIIKSIADTVNINQAYEAELIVSYNNYVLPNFNIVIEKDTFLVPFDENKKCGTFKTVGRSYGKNIYNGFVIFIDENNNKQKKDFEISFYVK